MYLPVMTQKDDVDQSSPTKAIQKCHQAQRLWLTATTLEDLEDVEGLYRSALNSQNSTTATATTATKRQPSKKKQKAYAELTPNAQRRSSRRRTSLAVVLSVGKAPKGQEGTGISWISVSTCQKCSGLSTPCFEAS
jgi:hypothetical protein